MRRLFRKLWPRDLSLGGWSSCDPCRLFRIVLNARPVGLVTGIHRSAKDARINLGRQAVVIRPGGNPVGVALRSLDLCVGRHLHRGDELTHLSSYPRRSSAGGWRAGSFRPTVTLLRPTSELDPI